MWDCLWMAKTVCSPRSVRRHHRCSKWLLCSWRMVWWSWTHSTPMWVTLPLSCPPCELLFLIWSPALFCEEILSYQHPECMGIFLTWSPLYKLPFLILSPPLCNELLRENPYSALSPLSPSRPDTICSFTLSLPFSWPSPHSVLPVLTPFALSHFHGPLHTLSFLSWHHLLFHT